MRWFWIDRFTEFISGERATAIKNVTLSEEHLHDHFPGYPVMPGSLMVEGMAQTGGLLVSEHYQFEQLVVLGKIARCELQGLVRPGESIRYDCTVEQLKEGGAVVSTEGVVGERLVASAEIFFARLEPSEDQADHQLFHQNQLLDWLRTVGVFDVGRTPQGERLTPSKYGFEEA